MYAGAQTEINEVINRMKTTETLYNYAQAEGCYVEHQYKELQHEITTRLSSSKIKLSNQ
jgi:hypothetical protein